MIGLPELAMILVIGLVVFGPGKLPEVGKAVGKSLNEFKKAANALSMDEGKPPAPAKPEIPASTVQQASAPQQPPVTGTETKG